MRKAELCKQLQELTQALAMKEEIASKMVDNERITSMRKQHEVSIEYACTYMPNEYCDEAFKKIAGRCFIKATKQLNKHTSGFLGVVLTLSKT